MTAVLRLPGAQSSSGTAWSTPALSTSDVSNVGRALRERRLAYSPDRKDRLLANRAEALMSEQADISEKPRTTS